jgi:threonine dehydrogenase-like Zn-dependent dehydrogenase
VGARESVEFLLDITDDVVALFGVQRQDYTYRPRHNRVTLCGYKGHSRQSADYAMQLILDGKLNLAPLVTHSFPLCEYGRATDLLEQQQALKVCLLPWA